ncbi:helix-turn-helix domain-containing protein [Sporosalibacterium faouarense]|uniref:helix-turn-helix domain-containing protein n=1 Tax=Sporosalibacterium faouarense TaxID=516123 RepID=UPI00141CF7D9|nr:helix-turn-helix transcriptional regulator [Sporosalibacterium faouarense]MTI49562.1 helix-turn-helix transcriptional regulator [Bacillota bacterium]
MTFGSKLKELRIEKNMTQAQLAKIIKVARATIGRYEADERFPDQETLKKLASYFDVTIDYLLDRTNMKNYNNIAETQGYYNLNIEGLSKEDIRKIEEYIEFIKSKSSSDDSFKKDK